MCVGIGSGNKRENKIMWFCSVGRQWMETEGEERKRIGNRVSTSPIGDNVEDRRRHLGACAMIWIWLAGYYCHLGRDLGLLMLVQAFQWLTLELVLPARPAANTIPLRTSSIRHCCFVKRWDIGGRAVKLCN